MTAININDVIKAYIALRDEVDEVKKRHKEELAATVNSMDRIEAWLQNQLQTQGLTNFKGESGTAFLKDVSSVTVEDWDVTLPFIKEKELWEMLERRVSKTVVEDFIESTGEVPPGVSVKRATVVQVRRS